MIGVYYNINLYDNVTLITALLDTYSLNLHRLHHPHCPPDHHQPVTRCFRSSDGEANVTMDPPPATLMQPSTFIQKFPFDTATLLASTVLDFGV